MAARKVVVRCTGCAKTQTLRPSRIEPCDGYYCTPEHGPKDDQPPGLVREQIIHAAGGFWGWRDVVPSQEDMDAIARARAIMALGQAKQIVDEAVGGVA
ncbi:hypothetical protein ABZV78_22035 [Micromonospora sp. NPDC004540]|uniref:hypothetical protein n=1 Tax=Micromonospora sp. NPDC004540 TaxID=3154457 RepID=UPI0033A37367